MSIVGHIVGHIGFEVSMSLTDTKISKLKWDDSKRTPSGKIPQYQVVSDTDVKGLHLRIYPPTSSGKSTKTFYLKYGPSSKRMRYRIGAWGEWSLREARTEARRVRRAFYDHQIDPNQVKKQEVQEAKGRLTVRELAGAYLAEHESEWSPSYLSANRTHSRKLIKDYGTLFAENLSKKEVKALFMKVKEGDKSPAQAHLLKGFILRMYNWGMDENEIDDMANPAILVRSHSRAKNPYKIEKVVRKRVLESSKQEATQLFDMLKDYDPLWTYMTKLYLLAGLRNTELRKAKWEDVDISQRTLNNYSPKGGRMNAYKVPLCDMAIDCLKGLGLGKIATGPIFPAEGLHKSTDKPRSDWDYWYRTISEDPRMPLCPDEGYIQIHDLRRTSITWLQEMRVSVENRTIYKGSRPSGVTSQTYSQADQYHIRKACQEMIEDRIHDIQAGNEETMFDEYRKQIGLRL